MITLCVSCSVMSDSAIHGTLQARILEWGDIAFSRGSSPPREWNQVSRIAGRFFTVWAAREAQNDHPDHFQRKKKPCSRTAPLTNALRLFFFKLAFLEQCSINFNQHFSFSKMALILQIDTRTFICSIN